MEKKALQLTEKLSYIKEEVEKVVQGELSFFEAPNVPNYVYTLVWKGTVVKKGRGEFSLEVKMSATKNQVTASPDSVVASCIKKIKDERVLYLAKNFGGPKKGS